MTSEIHINQWKQFFDETSREKLNWQTKIEVLDAENGTQILSEGLPLGGLTFEDKNGQSQIEIIVGRDTEHHQTHNILTPSKVYFRRVDADSAGTLEIEETSGTKTLVYLTEPTKASVKNGETEVAKGVAK